MVRNSDKSKIENRIYYNIVLLILSLYPLFVLPQFGYYSFSIPKYLFLAVSSLTGSFFLIKDGIKINCRVLITLAFFICCLLISTINSSDTRTAWLGSYYRMTGFSTYAFCIILFAISYKQVRIEKLLFFMVAFASVVSSIALIQHLGLNIIPDTYYSGRPYGTMGNPNWLGTYLVFIVPASIILFLRSNKLLLLIFTGFIYAGILVSLSRSVWLAFFVTFVTITLYVWCYARNSRKKPLALLVLVLFIVTCVLLPTNDGIIVKKALSIPDQMVSAVQYEDTAGSNRMYIWKETVKLIKKNWEFGTGPDQLKVIMPNGSIEDKAHNIFLEIAVTMGIFSLISYLLFLLYLLQLRYCSDELGFLFFIMIFTYLLQGIFNNDVIMVLPLLWIVFGLSLANMKRIDEEFTKGGY